MDPGGQGREVAVHGYAVPDIPASTAMLPKDS